MGFTTTDTNMTKKKKILASNFMQEYRCDQ